MMVQLRHFCARLMTLFRGGELDRDFQQELDAHLDLLTEDNIRRGLPPDEARRQAAVRLGAASSLRSQHRDVRGLPIIEDLAQDLRFAARLMRKERWFSAAAIAAIALGIGANTVGFTIVNAAFLRGFPFEEAERLRAISWRPDSGRRAPSSVLDLEDWRSQSRSFSGIAAYTFGAINISDDHAAPQQTQGAWVTANHFDVLRQRPVLGRTFVAGDQQRGADPVVIIGHEIWKNRFDLDPSVIGRVLRINGQPSTIIGVMPELMKFPDNAGSELWVPFVPTDAQLARDRRVLTVFGRLAPGVSATAAEAELDAIAQRIRSATSRSDDRPRRRTARDLRRAFPRRRCATDADHGDGRGDLRAADRMRQCREPDVVAVDVSHARSRGALFARRHPLAHRPAAADRKRGAVGHWRCVRARDGVVRRARRSMWRCNRPGRRTGCVSPWTTSC